LQRAEHPAHPRTQHHHDVLHAEHVRLQPLVQRPAVQLLGHRRDRHGRHHRGHRLRRPTPRFAEGGAMSTTAETLGTDAAGTVRPEASVAPTTVASSARTARAARPGRPTRRRSSLRPRKSVAFTLMMSILVIYSLLPLAWLVINATKTQAGLFSSF